LRVATHASDIDGIVSAALVLMKNPNAKIDFLTLRDIPLVRDVEYDVVIDLPKTKRAKVNIDHHLSNYEKLVRNNALTERDIVDPKAPSAASLLIKYLGLEDDKKARKLVEIANIADTGGYTKEIYILDKIIKCHTHDQSILMKIAWILVEKGEKFLKDEWIKSEWQRIRPWIEKGRKISEEIVKKSLKMGLKFLIVDLLKGFPRLSISDLQWFFMRKGGKVIIVINRMTESDPVCPTLVKNSTPNYVRASIRVASNYDFDARRLAEKLGGGGHIKASGARISSDDYYRALSIMLKELSEHGYVGYVKVNINSDI